MFEFKKGGFLSKNNFYYEERPELIGTIGEHRCIPHTPIGVAEGFNHHPKDKELRQLLEKLQEELHLLGEMEINVEFEVEKCQNQSALTCFPQKA